jgi:uncharacterized protein (DUF1697 family)
MKSSGQTGDSTGMVYLALLRGINVGGHRLVKMADLRAMFAALGFHEAQTYIQSGNVIFRATEAEEPLRERIERQIAATFGFPVAVVLRTADEMARAVANCPFMADALGDGESLYVALLADVPPAAGVERLLACATEPDEWRIVGREVYLLYRQHLRLSQLTNNLLESKIGIPATTRNWRTITTLAAMSEAAACG